MGYTRIHKCLSVDGKPPPPPLSKLACSHADLQVTLSLSFPLSFYLSHSQVSLTCCWTFHYLPLFSSLAHSFCLPAQNKRRIPAPCLWALILPLANMFLHEIFNQAGGFFSSQSKIQAGIRPQNAFMHKHAIRECRFQLEKCMDVGLNLDELFS